MRALAQWRGCKYTAFYYALRTPSRASLTQPRQHTQYICETHTRARTAHSTHTPPQGATSAADKVLWSAAGHKNILGRGCTGWPRVVRQPGGDSEDVKACVGSVQPRGRGARSGRVGASGTATGDPGEADDDCGDIVAVVALLLLPSLRRLEHDEVADGGDAAALHARRNVAHVLVRVRVRVGVKVRVRRAWPQCRTRPVFLASPIPPRPPPDPARPIPSTHTHTPQHATAQGSTRQHEAARGSTRQHTAALMWAARAARLAGDH